MSGVLNMIDAGALGWPAAVVLGLAVLRELFRLLAYVIGLAVVLRGTAPGDRSAVLRAYDRRRFDTGPCDPGRKPW